MGKTKTWVYTKSFETISTIDKIKSTGRRIKSPPHKKKGDKMNELLKLAEAIKKQAEENNKKIDEILKRLEG